MAQLKPLSLVCLALCIISTLGDHLKGTSSSNTRYTVSKSYRPVYRQPSTRIWNPKPSPVSYSYGYPGYKGLTSIYTQPRTFDWSKYYVRPRVTVAKPAISYPVGGASYPVGGASYPVGGASYTTGGDSYQPTKKGKNGHLDKLLEQYKEALASCTNPQNFACKFDIAAGEEECDLRCIPLEQRCDGRRDCPHGEDEDDCEPPECTAGQIRCCSTEKCATPCDDVVECDWEEDEMNCDATRAICEPNQLKCPEGNCANICNGEDDCINGEDERNCNIDTGCLRGEYVCNEAPGAPIQCAVWCGGAGDAECGDGMNNDQCNTRICSRDEIPCETIEPDSNAEICADLCDDEPECADSRDEQIELCFQCVYCSGETDCMREDEC